MSDSSTAIVFPGQGAQRHGMGRDFHDSCPIARMVYQEASEALGIDMAALCFEGDDRLMLTEYAQPAILTTEIAMLRALQEEFGLEASCYGGHSLGEYAALVAAGALGMKEAVRMVKERGRLMQAAVPVGHGSMVAVISEKLDAGLIEAALEGLQVALANDNSISQVVVSGPSDEMEAALARVGEVVGTSGARFVPLEVSAPFHSPLMAIIEPAFEKILRETVTCLDDGVAAMVTSNYSGRFHESEPDAVIQALTRQISGTVRWRDNMEHLSEHASRVIEVGPGRPLRAFFKTLDVNVLSITSLASARRALGEVGGQ
ncbi:MAG: ACP S-malonyltransferase [Deltaproteobacteria bacterium]|nr:ACP S-malonyltransferase [Deltaproteobacteria bacterium]